MKIEILPLHIPLKIPHRQASGGFSTSQSLFIRVTRGKFTGLGEGCPRVYQTGEAMASALAWLSEEIKETSPWQDLASLRQWVVDNERRIDKHPAAFCALETALLDLFAQENGVSVEGLLGVAESPSQFRYSAVIGAYSGPILDQVIGRFIAGGFSDFKVKITGGSHDLYRIKRIQQLKKDARIRLDCNNAFERDPVMASKNLAALMEGIWAIEEPFQAQSWAEASALGRHFDVKMILDESLTTQGDLTCIQQTPGPWIANLKISRLGGCLRALTILERWGERPVIIGAQAAETSILTRAGQLLARAAGPRLLAHEGGFGQLLLRDEPIRPTLTMAKGGRLDLHDYALEKTGWGLHENHDFQWDGAPT